MFARFCDRNLGFNFLAVVPRDNDIGGADLVALKTQPHISVSGTAGAVLRISLKPHT